MVNAVIHIGLQKTANTTLQAHFYPKLKDLLYLGRFQQVDGQKVIGPSYFYNEDVSGAIRQIEKKGVASALDSAAVKERINLLCAETGATLALLSNEEISAFSGLPPCAKLELYCSLFDDVKVIYSIRDQLELLKSLYLVKHRAEHFSNSLVESQSWTPSFSQWMDINDRYCFGSLLDSFKFHEMIVRYREVVGAENLYVYDFAEFRRDPSSVMARLSEFMGIAPDHDIVTQALVYDQNRRPTKRLYAYAQMRRRLFPGVRLSRFMPLPVTRIFSKFLWSSEKMEVRADAETVERIRNYYAKDNALLASEFGFSFGQSCNAG